jgi:glycosyltransferase involved in cell wall biosynthesis
VSRSLDGSACRLANGGNTALPGGTWIHYLHATHAPCVNGSLRTTLAARAGRHYHLRCERKAIERAEVIICNSVRTAADVTEHYRVPESRLRVIYYGIDAERFRLAPPGERAAARQALGIDADRYAAVFAGALGDRRKGFDVLFDAWQTLHRDPAWNVDLLVVGAGGEQTSWLERAQRAGLAGSIRFFGFRDDIAALFAAADVVVHPARYEAYGLAVHEAICRCVPALVGAGTGIAERYPRELGGLLLADPLSSRALVTSLRAWRAHAAEWRKRVGLFAVRLASRSWDQMAAEIAAAIES